MSQFLWNSQFVGTNDARRRDRLYQPGSFPRYSSRQPGLAQATAKDLGCCEQLDEEAFAILLAMDRQAYLTAPPTKRSRRPLKSYCGGGTGDHGALGGAVRSISFVDRGDHRRG